MPPAEAASDREAGLIERGRESYANQAWTVAYEFLSRADAASSLEVDDVELLATTAYMLGRDDEWMRLLERAHHRHLEGGEPLRAARCAGWIGMNLAIRGETGPSAGWLGRAQRLLDREAGECVEHGYILLPLAFEHVVLGDYEAAAAAAADAAAIGERFRDADLFALAVQGQGEILIKQGRVKEGLGLLDEAMVAVTAGELSPIPTGLVYCSVIAACQEVYELRRAREWTAALTTWCEQQSGLLAFTGRCLVHRAEILQLHGAWREALDEARQAQVRLTQVTNQRAAADASYRQGELQRLLGELNPAEVSYRQASRAGREPQPGLALLRLAQGSVNDAAAAIRRALGETAEPLERASLLPAFVEIMLAVGDIEQARSGCEELEQISASYESRMLAALAAHARGAVELADGDARAALVSLRRAGQVWQELEAPYEAARARVLVGLACRALDDRDAVTLELEAARAVFDQLGAAPDLARVDSLTPRAAPGEAQGLTLRELQVLRLVAAGETNKRIAAELVLSDRTIDRHVSNIFTKLGVSSRAAATAYAYEHQLV